ncbi:MAG: type I restriction endonuclease subunit R [Bacteroidales bacterium]|nr:type I restriction endonuclease subunit R [Bacteroidales bacterium]
MIALYNESSYEKALIDLFRDKLGYEYLYGPDVERDYYVPFYEAQLRDSVSAINFGKPHQAVEEAITKLKNIDTGSLVQKNEVFMDYLQNGVEVSYYDGEEKHDIVYLVDYDNPHRNTFQIINQWTFIEKSEKRADLIVFINGLPLVVMELKSPSREETDASAAYRQLRNYMHEIESLFVYNAFCVMSDMSESKAGTITSNEDRFLQWKSVDGKYEAVEVVDYDTFFEGMFKKERLLNLIHNFICFDKGEDRTGKILAGYHQYFAVSAAIERTEKAVQEDGRIGVFWHTTGSGKSLSMVFYAHLLQRSIKQPTIVVITDRNDLDDQLYGQFSRCEHFLRQKPVQASSRENLKELLIGREANGIIFTTMQKFEESDEPLSERSNIIVMCDEAHRGQYGLDERVDPETGEVKLGTAGIIRKSLPHASFIGFTGTPIEQRDRNTREVFGDYINIYDMTQSVLDKATVPVYYESRVVNLNLDPEILKQIDEQYDLLAAEGATEEQISRSKHKFAHIDALLGADSTIDSLVRDIIKHYEENRQYELTGKAMVVAYSRPIAIKIYKKMLELRPDWTEKVKVVMTSGNNDPEEWYRIIGNKLTKRELGKKFKDDTDPMKIAIVVDMWLTGFDVPSLATMYVFKPMNGHNLMQAIARVNRVFKGKSGGLVIDYVGIAQALKNAMRDYTDHDRSQFGDMDIKKTAYVKFREKLEICDDLMHGFDYKGFQHVGDHERALLIKGGVNFLLAVGKEEVLASFKKEALLLRNAYSLCRSIVSEEERWYASYFETVRIMILRITGNGKAKMAEISARISELLKQSVRSEGVINLFADANKEFSLSDPAFLEELKKMEEKNVAIELLKNLIKEKVSAYKRTNVVQSEKFSEMFNNALSSYLKGMLTNEEVIQELIKLAQEIKKSEEEGNELGLTTEEKAFYDALTKPQAVRDAYENDELVNLTRELTEQLRKNRTIDWQMKESARADMRKMVKRLLKKYHYPPEEAQNAMEIVLAQCEQWADYSEAS